MLALLLELGDADRESVKKLGVAVSGRLTVSVAIAVALCVEERVAVGAGLGVAPGVTVTVWVVDTVLHRETVWLFVFPVAVWVTEGEVLLECEREADGLVLPLALLVIVADWVLVRQSGQEE